MSELFNLLFSWSLNKSVCNKYMCTHDVCVCKHSGQKTNYLERGRHCICQASWSTNSSGDPLLSHGLPSTEAMGLDIRFIVLALLRCWRSGLRSSYIANIYLLSHLSSPIYFPLKIIYVKWFVRLPVLSVINVMISEFTVITNRL